MVGWHHRLNGHEFEQALGDGEGQGSLENSSWGRRVRHDFATNQQPHCVLYKWMTEKNYTGKVMRPHT